MNIGLTSKWIKSISFLIVAISFAACKSNDKTEIKKVAIRTLPVTEVMVRDTIINREYVADIQAVRNVELRARVSGFLERIYVDEGQEVKKGQILFRINDEEYKAELAKATANLSSAIAEAKASELEVNRIQILVDKDVISSTELEVAKAKLKAANAKIEEARSAEANARTRLSYTSIRSPFNGIVDRLPLKIGSLIDNGTLLTTVSDLESIYAYFNVSEREYLEYIKTRQQNPNEDNSAVQLVLADGTTYPYEGKIETMQGEFSANTGSIAFRAHFPNADKLLKHGASGKVLLSNKVHDALMVPQKAVFEIQDKSYVFLVDANNQVRMTSFVPKSRFSYFYIVESGLEIGDKIVYEGIQNIRDGMHIKPQPIGMDSLIAENPEPLSI